MAKSARGQSQGVEPIYFIANPIEINLPFTEVNRLFRYEEKYRPQGFTSVASDKLKKFYEKYDDLYSILQRIKEGKAYEQKPIHESLQIAEEIAAPLQTADVDEILKDKELSDHIRVQWKLIHLGLKTGSKVWVPRNDQKKISQEYQFSDFETSFSAGIDMPAKYVENIDVIWKKNFV